MKLLHHSTKTRTRTTPRVIQLVQQSTNVVTGRNAIDKTTRSTAEYRPVTRRCIDRRCRGPAARLIAASSTRSEDPTAASSRHRCRQYLTRALATCPRPRRSAGRANRCVRRTVNAGYRYLGIFIVVIFILYSPTKW